MLVVPSSRRPAAARPVTLAPGALVKHLGTPISITGATATLTASAVGGTVALGTAGIYLSGATAQLRASAAGGTFELVDVDLNFTCDSAPLESGFVGEGVLTMTPQPGTPGQYFTAPLLATGLSGSVSMDFTSITTLWVLYQAQASGTLTLNWPTAGDVTSIYTYTGTDQANLVDTGDSLVAAGAVGGIQMYVQAGTFYYLQLVSYSGTVRTLSWQLTTDSSALSIDLVQTQLLAVPGVLPIQVTGAQPNEVLNVSVEGTSSVAYANPSGTGLGVVVPYGADESGRLVTQVAVPAVSAGTYQVRVSGSASGTTSVPFQVLNSAQLAPTPPGSDTPPSPPTQTGVVYWVLQDPAPGGLGTYIFPVNPSTADDPHAPRIVTWANLASASGPLLAWDTPRRATTFQFSGYVLTQAFHDQLEAYRNLNRRIWLFDNFGKKYLGVFQSLVFTPVGVANGYKQKYDAVFTVLQEA